MSEKISLKDAERKVVKATYNDGLADIFLGCFFLIFVIAPYLSARLGDFWSSMVFLPFWALVTLVIWLVRRYVVVPRIGRVKFGLVRKTRLAKLSYVILIINVIAFILGLVAALNFGKFPGQLYGIFLGMILLVGFSIAAYFLDFDRLFIYGLLVGLSPMIGEYLWSLGLVTHHGFPLTFGVTSGIMILVGLFILIRLLRNNPIPVEAIPS